MANKRNNQEVEIWRPVVGFEEKYEISNLGNLMSNNWNKTGQRRKVKTYLNSKTGYIYVVLQSNGKIKTTTIHRLVAEAFLPNPDNLEQVDHIDNCKTNNVLSNLRWVSRKFNNSRPHAIAMRKKNHRHTNHLHQFVKATKGGEVQYFKNAIQASKALGCANATVIKALNGQSVTAKGWVLEYVDRNLPECDELNKQLLEQKLSHITEYTKKMMEIRRKAHERKRKIKAIASGSRAGKKPIKNFRRLARAVVQLDLDGTPIREWDNTFSAEKELHINGIREVLFGMKESTGGFKWAWKLDI